MDVCALEFIGRGLCGLIRDEGKVFVLLEDAHPFKEDGLKLRVTVPSREGWMGGWKSVGRYGWCKIIDKGARELILHGRELIHDRRHVKLLLLMLLSVVLLLLLIGPHVFF